MTGTLQSARAELRRLLRWPAVWVVCATWLVLDVLFTYVFDWLSYRSGEDVGPAEAGVDVADLLPAAVPEVFVQGMPVFGGALMLVLGALAVGSGYAWGTWKTVLTQGPGRSAAFGGTMLALSVLLAGLLLVTLVVNLSMAALVSLVEGESAALPGFLDMLASVAAGGLILGMWTAVGVLGGVLARGPALAVGLGLVWTLVVENLLRGVSSSVPGMPWLTDHLPGTAAGSLAGALRAAPAGEDGTPGVLDVLSGAAATGWLVAYLLLACVGALVLVQRRDVG